MSTCRLSVVVPCYNEEQVITTCHETLTRVLSPAIRDYQIVYVNDGSTDNTYELLQKIQSTDARVKVVDLARNFGHQIAVSAGLAYAEGAAVGLIDADLQDPPEVLLQMVQLWEQGYEVVFGVRKTRSGESWFKLKTAEWFYRVLNFLSDTAIPRDTGDFRLLDRKAVDALLRMPERDRMLRGLSSWIGFRHYGLEYERLPRLAGVTKYPLHKMLRLALDGILSFSVVPLRLVSILGVATAGISMLGISYALVLRLFTRIWVPGWTLLFIGMLFIGGLQMLSLGIVGEYIGRIYTEAKQRPLYLVREVLSSVAQQPMARKAASGSA
ncbi:MAG TPA: glycosyltransferase family 2 protein [Chthoniobacterales bacterium]|nr:glycosyltransferase family 2 protein [Chthoniobacterales bacterium]